MQIVEFNDQGEPIDPTTRQPIVQKAAQESESPSEASQKEEAAPAAKAPVPKPEVPSEGTPKASLSRYQVKQDSEFTIRFCIDFQDSRPRIYKEDAKDRFPEMESHWVTFRMWTYAEELAWRRECLEYDQSARIYQTNTALLDELKLRRLMKSWSFGEYDASLKLLHTGGVLSDESYDIIRGFYPAIIDHIVYRMNEVLESNG